jgi:hypothetical protein
VPHYELTAWHTTVGIGVLLLHFVLLLLATWNRLLRRRPTLLLEIRNLFLIISIYVSIFVWLVVTAAAINLVVSLGACVSMMGSLVIGFSTLRLIS